MNSVHVAANTSIQKYSAPESGDVQWDIGKNAQLIFVQEHILPADTDYVCKLRFVLHEGSSLTYVPIMLGGKSITVSIELILNADCQAIVKGAYASQGHQKYMIKTRQEHQGARSKSILAINGIAAGHSSINYQGTIAVGKNATQTHASQENKTILWDASAQAISVPSLEVHTNDVRCAHGSAVGPLNQEHIRYSQSRGISDTKAKQLLLQGFFAQTLGTSIDPQTHERILSQLLSASKENCEYST